MTARLIRKKIQRKNKINTLESNWINRNFKYFINGTNDRNLISLLKTAKLKQKQSYYRIKANTYNYLTRNKIKAPKALSQVLTLKAQKNRKGSSKKKKTIHQQAVSKIRRSFSYPDRKLSKPEIKKEINSMISFIKRNISRVDSEIISQKLIDTALFYSRRKFYQQARQMNNLSLNLNSKKSDKAHFGNIWSYIYPSELKKAHDYIKINRLNIEANNNSSSQLMFWTAYVLEQNKNIKQANILYSQTMKKHPLSYYAVLASKFFKENNPENKELQLNPFQPAYEYFEFLFDSNKINKELSNIVRKIKLWSQVGSFDSAHRELKRFHKISPANYQSNPMSFKLLLAKILSESNYDLKAFQTLYRPIDKEEIGFNNLLLPILYPQKHIIELKNLTSKKDFDHLVVLSLIRQESAFNPRAQSGAGARGLMQLLPRTARGIKKKVTRDDLFIPEINLEIGTQYFEKVYKRYNKNLVYTLAAYNAGPHRVDEWRTTSFHRNEMIFNIENIPFLETRKYVKLIYRNLFFYKLMLSNDFIKDPSTPNKVFDVSWNYVK